MDFMLIERVQLWVYRWKLPAFFRRHRKGVVNVLQLFQVDLATIHRRWGVVLESGNDARWVRRAGGENVQQQSLANKSRPWTVRPMGPWKWLKSIYKVRTSEDN